MTLKTATLALSAVAMSIGAAAPAMAQQDKMQSHDKMAGHDKMAAHAMTKAEMAKYKQCKKMSASAMANDKTCIALKKKAEMAKGGDHMMKDHDNM